jgi:hypothetical protein
MLRIHQSCFQDAIGALVLLGAHDISVWENTTQLFHVNSSEIITHKCYNSTLLKNDVSLLKILSGIVFNDFVQPVKLNAENSTFAGFTVSSLFSFVNHTFDTLFRQPQAVGVMRMTWTQKSRKS